MDRRIALGLAALAGGLALCAPVSAPAAEKGCDARTVEVEKIPVDVSVCLTGFTGFVAIEVAANGRSVKRGLSLGAYGGAPGGPSYRGQTVANAYAPPAGVPSPAPTGDEGNSGTATARDVVDLAELGFPKERLEVNVSAQGFVARVGRITLLPEGTDL